MLRKDLHERFPDMTFFFQPANITTQILNFGMPAPIDVQVVGRDAERGLQDCARTGRRRSRGFQAPPTFTSIRSSTIRKSV